MAYIMDIVMRWGHIVFGVAWIGLLYYFNFVQTEYVKEADDSAKADVMAKLAPRARGTSKCLTATSRTTRTHEKEKSRLAAILSSSCSRSTRTKIALVLRAMQSPGKVLSSSNAASRPARRGGSPM